ncbi:hypothetical protein AB0I16_14815 [Streptomyces sp. NPDC050703]|uniref:hypothetical protein n=1 Tax=Streptomyces sp. NPDC050703 TaxID=3157218 RepID=UPI003418D27B
MDADVPVGGEPFASCWWQGRETFEATLAENGGVRPPDTAGFDGQGLNGEQIVRFAGGATPHPGASPTEPAQLTRPLGDPPATYVTCLRGGEEPTDDVGVPHASAPHGTPRLPVPPTPFRHDIPTG